MTAATPTTVMVKNDSKGLNYGTARRLVNIYVEISPAATNTTDLSTYVTNLSAISGLKLHSNATTSLYNTSDITWSGTTVTWKTAGAQFAEFTGYYT